MNSVQKLQALEKLLAMSEEEYIAAHVRCSSLSSRQAPLATNARGAHTVNYAATLTAGLHYLATLTLSLTLTLTLNHAATLKAGQPDEGEGEEEFRYGVRA
jgi:hypothetical protein